MMTHRQGIWRGAWGWIFETLVPGALVPLSCVCCQCRGERQRWYHISTAHKENCLFCETMHSFGFSWWKTESGSRKCKSLDNAYGSEERKLSCVFFFFFPGAVSITIFCCMLLFLWCPSWPENVPFLFSRHFLAAPPHHLQPFRWYRCSCVESHRKPHVWKLRLKMKGSEKKKKTRL